MMTIEEETGEGEWNEGEKRYEAWGVGAVE
jgi:hypothetical protein